MTRRCPRCESTDVHVDQTTLATPGDKPARVVFEYWCRQCKLNEATVTDAVDFAAVMTRWQSPRT